MLAEGICGFRVFSRRGKYIYIVIPMSLGPGWLFLGHRRGLGVGGDVGMLATPRNRSVWGENPSPPGEGWGVRKKYRGNKSTNPKPTLFHNCPIWPFHFVGYP